MYQRRMESLQRQMKNNVFFLILVGAGCLIGNLLGPYNDFCDYQDKLINFGELIQRIIGDVTEMLIGITLLFLARNIKRNNFFVVSTANLVRILGSVVILGAVAQITARAIWDASSTSHTMECALGIILLVLSRILEIGIKMREENDLTI